MTVGRLAPSPTGAQHVGNARTYLLAWLHARMSGGRVVLRIEDIDSPRTKPGAAAQAADDLRWLGLDWDGDVVVQSSRIDAHRDALETLKARDFVYPCTCTRGDIERAAGAPHADGAEPAYPGTCARRLAGDAGALDAAGVPYCWRFRVPEASPAFADGFRREVIRIDLRAVGGDFVVWKNGRGAAGANTPAYQLAVVVDDAAAGVTEVIRGDDLIPSTPRQLLIHEALGLTPPTYFHVPLVVGEDGRRLAKRHGDTRLSALREAGVSAALVRGLLANACGWADEVCEMSMEDVRTAFDLAAVPQQAWTLRAETLRAFGYVQ